MRDPAYVERFARECLGMIKPGEIPFVVVPKHGKAGAPSAEGC
jgi:cell division protein FtsB